MHPIIRFQSTPVNSSVFTGLSAFDPDSNVNGQVEFRVIEDDAPGINDIEGGGFGEGGHFAINLPHQGLVQLVRPLDYESSKIHHVIIEARDRYSVDPWYRVVVRSSLRNRRILLDHFYIDAQRKEPRELDEIISGPSIRTSGSRRPRH